MNQFLLFLNISGGEILVILVVVYLVFGPKKIPELARMVGKGINELRRATDDIKKEFNKEVSSIKKDTDVDLNIDLKDPLGIKKTVNDVINPNTVKRDSSPKTAQENKTPDNSETKPAEAKAETTKEEKKDDKSKVKTDHKNKSADPKE